MSRTLGTHGTGHHQGTADTDEGLTCLSSPESVDTSIGAVNQQAAPVLSTPWLTVREAAARAKCGDRSIYKGVRSGKLRAARLGGRRELRLLPEWVDAWLIATCAPVVVNEMAPSGVQKP
jgi:excisionase family DNA binding protein